MHSSTWFICFLLQQGKGRMFFFFLFSMCAHHVPKVFSNTFRKMFPIAPWFYSIWFAQSSIPMYINWKGGLWAREYICFYFAIGVQRGAPIGECPIVLKKLMMSRWLCVFQKKQKNYVSAHELLYMNHNRYPKLVSILPSWFELNLMNLRSRCTI